MFSLKIGIKKILSTLFTVGLIIITISILISALYPIGYKDYINKYSKEYSIDPFLIASIINVESKYNKNAISSKNARGLMQIGPSTGQWASEVIGIESYNADLLFDEETNIKIGIWYLNQLNKEFDNNLDLVLAAYNAGSGNVKKWLQDKKYSDSGDDLHTIPFKETNNYLKRVKWNHLVYSNVYKYYMLKGDNNSSLYVDLIINIKEFLKTNINKVPKGEKF